MLKKLTDDVVENLTGDRRKQQVFVWDKDATGLGLRVTSRGKKSWVYRYSINGRDRRITLGLYPDDMDLTAARQRVAELRQQVERREDPAREGTAAAGEGTLNDLWKHFEKKHLPRRSQGHQDNMRDHFKRLILPHFGKAKPLSELTWEEVDDWHQKLGKKSTATANLALATLRVAINTAKKWGWLERGAFNPASDHEAFPTRKAGRPFTDAELKKIGKALERESDPIINTAMTVYLLSGLRPREVCRLRWDDLGEGGVLFLEEAKTGQRCAVLPTRAEDLIRELPRASEFVFPGRQSGESLGGDGRSHGLGNAWKRIRSRAKLGPR